MDTLDWLLHSHTIYKYTQMYTQIHAVRSASINYTTLVQYLIHALLIIAYSELIISSFSCYHLLFKTINWPQMMRAHTVNPQWNEIKLSSFRNHTYILFINTFLPKYCMVYCLLNVNSLDLLLFFFVYVYEML